jgi:glutamate-1-semialdehyde 2,1-aminomutase
MSLFERAQARIPGGVNSPVRAYKSVGLEPVFIDSARGCRVRDRAGREYVDYVLSYGPHILGHGHPAIVQAIQAAAERGVSFGAPTEGEVTIAEKICAMVPGLEMVRLVNSGTEATMSAVRLARAATGRDRILKFDGCYHGHADGFLVKAGSGALTFGHPDSPGVPRAYAELTSIADYNDLESVERMLLAQRGKFACVIVEPIAGNIGLLPPAPGFLAGLRQLASDHGALLIFDEVMTGFRVAAGGAQELYGVCADLVTFGKVIGGGMPVGAYGGRRDLMQQIAPAGPVYQAGTLSGNPVAVAAGLAALNEISKPGFYAALDQRSQAIAAALTDAARESRCPMTLNRVGSMFCPYFGEGPLTRLAQVMATRRDRFRAFFAKLLEHGVMPAPSPFEAWFASTAHDDEAIETTHRAAVAGFRAAAALA